MNASHTSFDRATTHLFDAIETLGVAEFNLFVMSIGDFVDQDEHNTFIATLNKVRANLTSLHPLLADNKEYIPSYKGCWGRLIKLQVEYKNQSYYDGVM